MGDIVFGWLPTARRPKRREKRNEPTEIDPDPHPSMPR